MLGEGRHFRDPFLYDREVRPVVTIPAGKIGVVEGSRGQRDQFAVRSQRRPLGVVGDTFRSIQGREPR